MPTTHSNHISFNRLVLESLEKLEDDRRCWRLVNGVLFEKSKLEVVPELL